MRGWSLNIIKNTNKTNDLINVEYISLYLFSYTRLEMNRMKKYNNIDNIEKHREKYGVEQT